MEMFGAQSVSDDSCNVSSVEVDQSFTVILDPLRTEGPPARKEQRGWTVTTLFDRDIRTPCLVADSSTVRVTLPDLASASKLLSQPIDIQSSMESTAVEAIYDAKSNSGEQLGARNDVRVPISNSSVPVEVNRFLTGHGQEKGGVAIYFANRNAAAYAAVSALECYPWWLRVYVHTLKAVVDGVATERSCSPAIDRARPSLLHLHLLVPPNSSILISFEFDKAHLRYTEHPPDASRGFDLGPSVAAVAMVYPSQTIILSDPVTTFRSIGHSTRVYTCPLLVALPTPDFSMPYNVVTMSCTLLAFLFGSVFNMLTRRFVPVVVEDIGPAKGEDKGRK
ncbi:Subunit of the glycosylphosphatidylinositol transamidase complex-like protein [Gonapodya sp. JEL0774]|nr:Subunit of the glycosylphosphatidylinositol transamidase complex-like protein [Gonapodya sp. JEL0774]